MTDVQKGQYVIFDHDRISPAFGSFSMRNPLDFKSLEVHEALWQFAQRMCLQMQLHLAKI